MVLYSQEVSGNDYARKEIDGESGGQTADLYKIAKAFITALTA